MQCARRLPRCRQPLSTIPNPGKHINKRCYGRATPTVQQDLRHLLREIPQPVALITTTSPSPSSSGKESVYHGATVSSLYSISLAPHPLLSFSLRLPSRLASALKAPSHPDTGSRIGGDDGPKRAVIHYLSSTQADIARTFAAGNVSADPFTSLSVPRSSTTHARTGRSLEEDDHAPFFLDPHGVPVIKGCIGAVSCEVLMQGLPLDNLSLLRNLAPPEPPDPSSSTPPPSSSSPLPSNPTPNSTTTRTPSTATRTPARNPFAFPFDYAGIDVDEHAYEYTAEGYVHSELFIVRATQVLYGQPHSQSPGEGKKPLMYHNRIYCVPGEEVKLPAQR